MDTKLLRQKILDLAIRGKLVPQDPNDEPASVLLERIRAEKEQLIKEGKIKRGKKSTTADKPHYEQVPFEVPSSWEWATIENIAESNIGLTYKPSDVSNTGVPVFRSNNIQNREICLENLIRVNAEIQSKQYLYNGDLLICARNGSRNLVGKCAIVKHLKEPSSFGAFMAVCRSEYNPWIFICLNSEYFNRYLDASNSTAINQVTQKMLLAFNIPFPPQNEQKRIIKEIKKWFEYIDILEQEKNNVADLIQQTKSKILDLAIHGKLVPQDPADEPAIELLKRINPDFVPADTSHYENLPQGWTICQVKDIFTVTMGQSPTGESINGENGIEFHQGKIHFTETYLNISGVFTNQPTKIADANSLLLCVRAPVGVLNITNRKICIGRGLSALRAKYEIDTQYWLYILSVYKNYFESNATGTTFKAISGDTIKNAVIKLPPRKEQQRILARINSLYKMLDTITADL